LGLDVEGVELVDLVGATRDVHDPLRLARRARRRIAGERDRPGPYSLEAECAEEGGRAELEEPARAVGGRQEGECRLDAGQRGLDERAARSGGLPFRAVGAELAPGRRGVGQKWG